METGLPGQEAITIVIIETITRTMELIIQGLAYVVVGVTTVLLFPLNAYYKTTNKKTRKPNEEWDIGEDEENLNGMWDDDDEISNIEEEEEGDE